MNSPDETNFQCPKCPRVANQKHKILRHVREVHDPKVKYACDECFYTSTRENNLMRHQRQVHMGIR